MSQTACPRCHAFQTRRVGQRGFWQQAILSRLGYFPWECRFCKASFMLRNRGRRRRGGSAEAGEAAAAD